MIDKQPTTQEQIKEVWEWCGFRYIRIDDIPWCQKPAYYETDYWYANDHWIYPDGSKHGKIPNLDLNNLFKYAVPKLVRCQLWRNLAYDKGIIGGDWEAIVTTGDQTTCHLLGHGEGNDPALALFWAIWEIIKSEQAKAQV